ncbi:glycoside hydrolase family 92 protein [Crucibulum laeve]|uniref:Glycoside hydrolase family 92 protein n=1 Tax=Crucibulum laeve TaxID=68775 RepID=A0A5C3M0F4_9AGAR|nr:glycoside hydrolase family 92 protein [Crucibulum laeve]
MNRCRASALVLPLLFATCVSTTQFIPPPAFAVPESDAIDHVNLLIGNGGDTPNGSGGMIPSTAPPFGMTRWVAQTQVNYVSATPYNWTHNTIHGFQATRQPAIWMGESASIALVPGLVQGGVPEKVKVDFEERGMKFKTDGKEEKNEVITPAYYSVELDDGNGGTVKVEQTATSRVGHLRFTFSNPDPSYVPYILLEASRPSIITSTPTNITYPIGGIFIPSSGNEICGFSNERQDRIIAPISSKQFSNQFKGFFCARFDRELKSSSYGVVQNGTVYPRLRKAEGELLSAYSFFEKEEGEKEVVVNVRVGTSFISVPQARANIDAEIPDSKDAEMDAFASLSSPPGSLEHTSRRVRAQWTEKLNRITIEGATEVQKEIFMTGVVHALQYPSEQHEILRGEHGGVYYYSGYDDTVHEGVSYTGYSIWDTYRAQSAWLILFAPERVPGMIASMLADYKEGGWLPMWKNIVETNIMVGTHADSLIAEAVLKGVKGFDTELAWDAVWKDASVPPVGDDTVEYSDREENVDYEVRAGLSSVYDDPGKGWVADDIHSESASRTLDYAYDDYAAYVLARELGKPANVTNFLLERSLRASFTLFNDETGFMEARNADGSWAGEDRGWTEGDKWAYSFDVVHDIPELIKRRGGNESFVNSLEEHFNGGHNDHTNEPSHHIPYLYAFAGAAYKTQERVREIARDNYNNTPTGLSGNEDCGQMSAWYLFSAMGFYPVNPVSGEYVVGSPLFDTLTIDLPPSPSSGKSNKLIIRATDAPTKPYIKSLTINGEKINVPFVRHDQIANGGEIVFEMSNKIEAWGNSELFLNVTSREMTKAKGTETKTMSSAKSKPTETKEYVEERNPSWAEL